MSDAKKPASGNGESGEHVFDNLTDMLNAPVGMHGDTMVTQLEALGAGWRRTAVEILKKTDPKGHETYRAIKYGDGGQTSEPTLAKRREAYEWAAIRVLERHFAHPLCEAWRQAAAKVVEALDPATYIQYQQTKHGAGEPTAEQKIEAYKIVVRRFLELAYTIPAL
jgi:hypothetical protein